MTEKTKKTTKKVWTIKLKNGKKIEIPTKEVIEIGIFIVVLFMATFGTFFILQASLHTKTPMVVVTSGSMEPTIYKGDLLFIKGMDPAEIEVGDHVDRTGDIIVFEAIWSTSGDPIVHRVVDSRYNATGEEIWEFSTWGDNNAGSDQSYGHPWVREDEIVGVVGWKVPKIGWIKIWLSGAAIPIIVILIFVLIISIVWDLTHPESEEEKKKKSRKRLFKRSDELKEFDNQNENHNGSSVNLGV
jgi:signal peptidase